MVRLKVRRFIRIFFVILKFQFHYGTIKSAVMQSSDPLVKLFQFHYGTIKSCNQETRNERRREFQFHYGTIKSSCEVRSIHEWFVSIPLWYD